MIEDFGHQKSREPSADTALDLVPAFCAVGVLKGTGRVL